MKTRRFAKVSALLAGGILALGSGGCLPNNFWANALGRAMDTTADAVLDMYVVSQVTDMLAADEE